MPLRLKKPAGLPLPWPLVAGLLSCLLGTALYAYAITAGEAGAGLPSPAMRAALAGSGMAAAATALGTLPVLLAQRLSQAAYDAFLGCGAGMMLGATLFSLVIPALQAARAGGATATMASFCVGAGIAIGALLAIGLGRYVHVRMAAGLPDAQMMAAHGARRVWLFVAAITLHNLPEGLAIGVACAGPDIGRAQALATGISIQDIPEGLAVALALRSVGHGRRFSAALGVLSGLVEPLAAMAGVMLIGVASGMLPLALAAAAGAMLHVIVHEVIPESHRHGNGAVASMALVIGFIVMMVLDTALS